MKDHCPDSPGEGNMAKHDLAFDPPIMNAAGSLGFYPDLHSPIDWSMMGAFVSNPISLTPRTPARGKRFAAYPGGFLLHTGYPNNGLSRVLHRHAERWSRSPVPVIVHLLARGAVEVALMARSLETVEGVSGLEVGVVSEASADLVAACTQAACGELPVIIQLPMERSIELAAIAIQAGAVAVSLAPPRGILPTKGGEMLQGRLYGPAVLPLALRTVHELAQQGIPTIGAGGVYTLEHSKAMLAAGALAVQLDTVLWRGAGYRVLL
jgi:dihydroorotate dehydrogenase (NAD+) catalytic subunit